MQTILKASDSAAKKKVTAFLKKAKLVILPTDTIYGMHCLALNPSSVEKIYKIKKRSRNKSLIILISKIEDLNYFNINLDNWTKNKLSTLWPNKVTVILPCPSQKFFYLHQGQNTLAFRIPNQDFLLDILKETGPLISTSANMSGDESIKNRKDAVNLFGETIDLYIDGGTIDSSPSTVISIKGEKIKILRQGAVKLKKL